MSEFGRTSGIEKARMETELETDGRRCKTRSYCLLYIITVRYRIILVPMIDRPPES